MTNEEEVKRQIMAFHVWGGKSSCKEADSCSLLPRQAIVAWQASMVKSGKQVAGGSKKAVI